MRTRCSLAAWIGGILSAVGVFLLVADGHLLLGSGAAVAAALFASAGGRRSCWGVRGASAEP
ncbi:MAG: hypothetical protein DIU55_001220 [Bacillota bacterium]